MNFPAFPVDVSALITFPKADRDLLIIFASSRVYPVASVFAIFSDPAKSQQYSLPILDVSVSVFFCNIVTWNMECEREEVAFILVAATDLFA